MSRKPNRVTQYKIANEKFLEAKAQEEGVKVLESGIIMRQLEVGTGDKYEVTIPAKYGYGSMKMDDIPAHSTLIFTLELLKIQ